MVREEEITYVEGGKSISTHKIAWAIDIGCALCGIYASACGELMGRAVIALVKSTWKSCTKFKKCEREIQMKNYFVHIIIWGMGVIISFLLALYETDSVYGIVSAYFTMYELICLVGCSIIFVPQRY